jgi:hypothetical protein
VGRYSQPQEKVLVDVLQSHGPVLERETFRERCRQRGLDEGMFDRLTSDSPIVHERDGRYALVGTTLRHPPAPSGVSDLDRL